MIQIGITVLFTLFLALQSAETTNERSSEAIVWKIRNLNGLSSLTHPQYDNIFDPMYVNEEGNYFEHNIHVIDDFGKFLKLKYEAKHWDNATILKLDEKSHKLNVESLSCKHHIDNTTELHFRTNLIADEYHKSIQTMLNDVDKRHFITAGHEWGCTETNGRYESVLREIINVNIEGKKLILQTEKAELVDIFETLDLEFSTDIGQHQHQIYHQQQQQRQIFHTIGKRRLGWFSWCSLCKKIATAVVDGVTKVAEEIIETVEKVADVAVKIVKYALGQPVDFNLESQHTWSWNYDFQTGSSLDTFDLATGEAQAGPVTISVSVGCTNCFAYVKLEYYYKLHLDNHLIQSSKMLLSGEAEINIDITGKTQMNISLVLPTPEIPIPSLSFSVAGFKFGVFISGEIEIGAIILLDTFAFQFNAYGLIKKGYEYDRSTDTQNYINEQEFRYNKNGPKMEFRSAKIILYAQTTIYLTLQHVGSLYFGIRPRLTLAFEKNEKLSESCALYFTPSLSLLPFIGVKIDILGFKWNKKINFEAIQPSISNWGGCIVQAKITQIQTVESKVTYYDRPDWGNYNFSADLPSQKCAYINILGYTYPIGEYYCHQYFDYNYSRYYTCVDDVVYETSFFDSAYCGDYGGTPMTVIVNNTYITDFNCDGSAEDCDVVFGVSNSYSYNPSINVSNMSLLLDVFFQCWDDLFENNYDIIQPFVTDTCSEGSQFYCDPMYGGLYQNYSFSNNCTNSQVVPSAFELGVGWSLDDVNYEVVCTYTPDCNPGGAEPEQRRRLAVQSQLSAHAFLDMNDIADGEYRTRTGWGSTDSQWWANMSYIPDICNDWVVSCSGVANGSYIPILTPTNATLLIHVIDHQTLIGVYQTYIEVTPTNGWNIANVTIYSNVSCIARQRLTLLTVGEFDDIPTYETELLEWRCDADLNLIGINQTVDAKSFNAWECMITLPNRLNAMQLDSSFGSIMLFDETWCQVFALTKKPQYTINQTNIANIDWETFEYPSRLWYGLWNCGSNISTAMELYFIGYNHSDVENDYVEAILTIFNDSHYMHGEVDLENMTMHLHLIYEYNATLTYEMYTFIGLLNILYDGTMTYSGSIDNSGCTGFIFQGYLNMTQFDDMGMNDTNQTTPTDNPTLHPSSHPSDNPTLNPSSHPSDNPTLNPSSHPSDNPTLNPSSHPSTTPTNTPSNVPTLNPSVSPSLSPTHAIHTTSDFTTFGKTSDERGTLSAEIIVAFIVGIFTCLMIIAMVLIFCKCKYKKSIALLAESNIDSNAEVKIVNNAGRVETVELTTETAETGN